MDLLRELALGLGVAFTLPNFLSALSGMVLGLLAGTLPGLGLAAMIAMLLPPLHALDATSALIGLAGVYCGASYGQAVASILARVPGPAAPAADDIDGYQMARQGRSRSALAVAGLSVFFAGCAGVAAVAVFAPPLAEAALGFGPAEYVSLIVLSLAGVAVLGCGSVLKAMAMALLGMLLAQTDIGVIPGGLSSSAGVPGINSGTSFVAIAIGLFGLARVIAHLGRSAAPCEIVMHGLRPAWPSRRDVRMAWPAAARGTALGALLGLLPGSRPSLASFVARAMERKLAGSQSTFGRGDVRAVAGPESAGSAGAQTSFMPVLSLGLPLNAAMALMVGAMAFKGIQPGPQMVSSQPQLFWGLVASMGIAHLLLLSLTLALAGLWGRLLAVPYRHLFPAVTVCCCIGAYTLGHDALGVYLAAAAAAAGYLFEKFSCEVTPLLLGFILGPTMEANLRGALLASGGDWSTFVTHPWSAAALAAAALMTVAVLLPSVKAQRDAALRDGY